jgi:hypothetical protein
MRCVVCEDEDCRFFLALDERDCCCCELPTANLALMHKAPA